MMSQEWLAYESREFVACMEREFPSLPPRLIGLPDPTPLAGLRLALDYINRQEDRISEARRDANGWKSQLSETELVLERTERQLRATRAAVAAAPTASSLKSASTESSPCPK